MPISALASTVNSGGYMWHREKATSPQHVRPPSPECAAKPPPPMPVSHICDYHLKSAATREQAPFKCAVEQGRVRMVANFRQGFNGMGAERYEDGRIYVGEYQGHKRHGRGTMEDVNGRMMVSHWKDNRPISEGAKWSTDHSSAARTLDGKTDEDITLKHASAIAKEIGLPCPHGWDNDFAC